jgi:hypothetical protein
MDGTGRTMSAGDVIKSWSHKVGANGLMFGAVSAIQPSCSGP